MVVSWYYPLVNVYITNWKINTMLFLGEISDISMVIFHSYVNVNQRVSRYILLTVTNLFITL